MGKRGPPATGQVPPQDSVFERRSTRQHFNILGRKVKGTSVNVAHSRSNATEKRKRTLLQEFRRARDGRSGKAGGFIDRRFGESDPELDADDKALRRLQRLRQKQLGKGGRFALGDEDDEEMFGHLGDMQDDFVPSDEDADDDLNELITREYHFGGDEDLFTKKSTPATIDGDDTPDSPAHKSKKEVMAEIIAKSKAAKRERALEREQDEEQLEALDAKFKQLADEGVLRNSLRTSTGHIKAAQRPLTSRRERQSAHDNVQEDDDDFDQTAKALASDIRASRVTDRLKTADELAAEKAAQLADLERKRMKRMRSRDSDDEAELSDDEGPQGGYKARRLKRHKREHMRDAKPDEAGDDDLDGNVAFDDGDGDGDGDDSGTSDEDDGAIDGVETGDPEDPDELRQSLKEKARSIVRQGDLRRGKRRLRRLGLLDDGGSMSSSTDDEEEEEEEGEEHDESEDEDAGIDAEDTEPEAEFKEVSDRDIMARQQARGAAPPVGPRRRSSAAVDDGAGDLPFVFDAPATHADFARWVDGRTPAELDTVISRICACHSIALAPENRRKMQTFFGVLVVHFEQLAHRSPMPSALLDALVPHLLALSREVPYYAATVARERLAKMQANMAMGQQQGLFAWPPARTLLLLRLFCLMFPGSDFRHPVLTPVALLLGQYLAHCEVHSVRDAAVGVMVATQAQQLATMSKRFVPEVLAFTASLVHANACDDSRPASDSMPVHLARQMGAPCLAVEFPKGSKLASTALSVAAVLQTPAEDAWFQRSDVRAAVLHAALNVLAHAADHAAALPSASVLLEPARAAVERLRSNAKHLPAETTAAMATVMAAHERAASTMHAPLQLHARKVEPIKTLIPKFEEDGFVKGRDYDVDRQRSEARKLKKQLQREAKGAARELRKDNRFLAEERARQMAAASAERDAKFRSALSFLEQQEADFKSGGQGGMMKRKQK